MELTVSSDPYDTRITETGILHDPAGTALLAISELLVACEALPDFDTLQILHIPSPPYRVCWCGLRGCDNLILHTKQWEQSRREQARRMKYFAIDCLRQSKIGRQEGKGRKRIMVRMVRLGVTLPHPYYCPGSVEVEEYEA